MASISARMKTSFQAFAFLIACTGAQAQAADLRVLLAVDPADLRSDMPVTAALGPAQSLTRATGMKATITQTTSMAEAMRASRTVENDVIIAPAHVTASAILHAYQLLASTDQRQTYVLVARQDLDQVSRLANTRLYLPQQDSLRSYLAKGLIVESGLNLSRFSKVTYGNTSGAGLVALMFKMADVTVADEAEAKTWMDAHPGVARILKQTRPVPSGLSMVVRKDFCASECGRLADWVGSNDSSIAGIGRLRQTNSEAGKQYNYIASLGIATPEAVKNIIRVDADMVSTLSGQDVVMIDTRSLKEFESEHVRGAVSAPYLEKSLKDIDFDATKDDFNAFKNLNVDKAKPVLFFCNGPECWKSYKASRAALAMGYSKIYWFRGGMPEWREKRLPVEGNAAALARIAPATKPASAKTVAAAR